MLISTGTTVPRWFSVAALYCLQNSIVCTPWGPSAVPTGGAGVAPPAGSWIFTTARIFFFGGMVSLLDLELGDLAEFELHGGLTTEDIDQDLELELVLVDLVDLPGEVGEGSFFYPHRLALFVLESRPRLLNLLHTAGGQGNLQDALDLPARQGGGLGTRTDETGHSGSVADDGPRVVVQIAPGEQVAREDLLLDDDLLAVLE